MRINELIQPIKDLVDTSRISLVAAVELSYLDAGEQWLFDTNEPFSLFVSVALLKFTHHLLDVKYLLNVIKSPVVQEQVRNNTRGVGNKNWVLDAVKSTIFPLPPLAEQHRIVARLNELLPLCDTLEEAK